MLTYEEADSRVKLAWLCGMREEKWGRRGKKAPPTQKGKVQLNMPELVSPKLDKPSFISGKYKPGIFWDEKYGLEENIIYLQSA